MPATAALWFVLWFRPARGSPWSMLGNYATEQESINAIDRGGDFIVLPAGQQP